MSQPPPEPPRRRPDFALWRPSRRAWLWVLAGFAIGMVLFVLVWSGGRDKPDFYRAGDNPPTSSTRKYTPLPAPLPSANDSGTLPAPPPERARDQTPERPRIVETAPPPPPGPQTTASEPAATFQARPIAGRTPAPQYPRQALRRGERGNVLVRAEIGPDGVPVSVSVAQSSGSRLLDRAATDAVLQWRFQPAELNGRPTVGTVLVPIEFRPD
ncbi:MAG: energy transducer TonB [Pseudomonadota bacterium]|nr:energy transducer TonB [Pseudomonadota bacterium]